MSRRLSLRSYHAGTKRRADDEEPIIVDLTADDSDDDQAEEETPPPAGALATVGLEQAAATEGDPASNSSHPLGSKSMIQSATTVHQVGQNDNGVTSWQGLRASWSNNRVVNVSIRCNSSNRASIKSEPNDNDETSQQFDPDVYQALYARYLTPRVHVGEQLPLGMRLRRQVRGRAIDSPGYEEFRAKIDKLIKQGKEQETYRVLLELRHWETYRRPVSWINKASNEKEDDDQVTELVDLSSYKEPEIIDADTVPDDFTAAVVVKQESVQTETSEDDTMSNRVKEGGNENTLTQHNCRDGARALALADALKNNKTSLQRLHVLVDQIGDVGAKALADALKSNTTLQYLDLMLNQIGDNGAKDLADALESNTALQQLHLGSNHIGYGGAKALADALKSNTTLKELSLGWNKIDDDGVKALADALKRNTTLQTLLLWRNRCGHDGAKALADALKSNTALQELELSFNKIDDDGAKALAEALKSNTSLKELSLGCNKIGDDGAKALAGALKRNTTLQTLNIWRNCIRHEGGKALAEALKSNTALQTLNLCGNKIGNDGTKALADALKSNTTLQELDLRRNQISKVGSQVLLQMLENHNGTLSVLESHSGRIPWSLTEKIEALVEANEENTRDPLPQPL